MFLKLLHERNFSFRGLRVSNSVSNAGTLDLQRLYVATIMSFAAGFPHVDVLSFDESGFSVSGNKP